MVKEPLALIVVPDAEKLLGICETSDVDAAIPGAREALYLNVLLF
jgi:hypothetical protein